jgi:hypothetical protein
MGAALGGAGPGAPAEGAPPVAEPAPAGGDDQPSPQIELDLPQRASGEPTRQA